MSIQTEITRIQSAKQTLLSTFQEVGITSSSELLIDAAAIEVAEKLKTSNPSVVDGVLTIPAGYIAENITFNIGEEMYSTLSFVKPSNSEPLKLDVVIYSDDSLTTVVGKYSTVNNTSMFAVFDGVSWVAVSASGLDTALDNKLVNLDLGTTLSSGTKYYVKYVWSRVADSVSVESSSYIYPSGVGVTELYEHADEVDNTLDEVAELLDDLNVEVI